MALFESLQIPLWPEFIENHRVLMSVSVLIVLPCAVLVEVYEEKLASHGYVAGKGRNIVMAFSDNYDILYLNYSKW